MTEKYIPIIILSSLFILFNLYIFIKKLLFIKQSISTVGVVKTASEGSLSNGSEGSYFQTVEFETVEGKVISISSSMGSSSDKGSQGAAVEVLYIKEEPENGVIKSFKNIWGFESIIFLLGCVGLFVYYGEL